MIFQWGRLFHRLQPNLLRMEPAGALSRLVER